MEGRNHNLLIVLIAAVIIVAVFSSFGLPLFANETAQIVLPTPLPVESGDVETGGEGGQRVEVTPRTVQSVIAALDRLESYSRTVTTTLEGTATTAHVWVNGGWTRTDLTTAAGLEIHTIVGEDTLWRWYNNEDTALSWPADHASADVEGQRIPTYEDVLELDVEAITAAGYETKDGQDCVYVEVDYPQLGQLERYWVSADSGLLAAAETVVGERVVWAMTATLPEIPVSANALFALPDGTVLHAPDAAALKRAASAQR